MAYNEKKKHFPRLFGLVACVPVSTPTIDTSFAPTEAVIIAPADTNTPLAQTENEPTLANCPMVPADNTWNARVDSLASHPMSDAWIDSIGRGENFHMDFGSGTWDGGPIGIPYNVISGSTVKRYTLDFYHPDESDAGPYPIPDNPQIEYGSDHHILVVETDACTLYETYDASFDSGQWKGGSGAIWDLNSNILRPET